MVGMADERWVCTELLEPPKGWIPVIENGWGALVLWAAGPRNFVRVRQASRERFGSMLQRLPGGVEQSTTFLLSEVDLASVDDDIDIYLAEADIPPRPRGFDWYIRRPSRHNLDDEMFWADIWAAATERLPVDRLRPSRMAGPAREAMASFYRD